MNVRINSPGHKLDGLVCMVSGEYNHGFVLTPLEDRPDGFRRSNFFWPKDDVITVIDLPTDWRGKQINLGDTVVYHDGFGPVEGTVVSFDEEHVIVRPYVENDILKPGDVTVVEA